jgi:hypothetical protein
VWHLALIYDSGKRYIIPFEVIEKYIDSETVEKIKTESLEEVQKIA